MPHPLVIIGGGLAGLTLSISLTHHQIPHQIYESAPSFSEIGAGIALAPNSISALELIDRRLFEGGDGEGTKGGFERCATYNEGGDGRVWMGIRTGMEGGNVGFNHQITSIRHTRSHPPGRACVHRARFLDELIKLIPPSITQFNKNLISITEPDPGLEIKGQEPQPLLLKFSDGTSATASAIIACDGIKSTIRRCFVLSGSDPASRPVFAGEFAYRALIPREKVTEITNGEIDPGNGNIYCGDGGYMVTYPVEKGRLMNLVAIKKYEERSTTPTTTEDVKSTEWPHHPDNWLDPVSTTTMLSDFSSWGKPLLNLLEYAIPKPERWALYDQLPAATYVKGRVVLMGDAAHAMVPHQGQGAGMGFEDSVVLSGILGGMIGGAGREKVGEGSEVMSMDPRIRASFQAFDAVRRGRTQKCCQTSREMGELIDFRGRDVGDDLGKLKERLDERMRWLWEVDLTGAVERGLDIAKKIVEKGEI